MRTKLAFVTIMVGLLVALLGGVGVAKADHRACAPPYPQSFTFPRRWSIYPGMDAAPWQLAQRHMNLADTSRDWLIQVPWGAPRDIAIIPDTANLSGGSFMMVILGCMPGYHSNSASIVIDDDANPADVNRWAFHELVGHAMAFGADHLNINIAPVYVQYYVNPGWCDPQGWNAYVGFLSYCNDPNILTTQDIPMLHQWYP